MEFLAMIIALGLVQVWGSAARVQHDSWFVDWTERVQCWSLPGWLRLALVVLLPTVLAQWLLNIVEPVFFGLLWIAVAALVLLYSFGRGDFNARLEAYRAQCHSGDFEAAFLSAQSEHGWISSQDQPESAEQMHALVQRGVLYEGYQRWFAVLFYFFLLGPAGALAYRLLQLCKDRLESEGSQQLLFYSDWVPARLLAATFSLTGDFVRCRDALRSSLTDGSSPAPTVLYMVGSQALGAPVLTARETEDDLSLGERVAQENTDAAALLRRSAFCWLGVLSLFELL